MNSLVTQDPWSFVPRLQTEINRLFGNANQSDSSSATATWVPAVDIHGYTRSERGMGHFYRRFVLPDTVDSEKVNANGKDGVLTITIAKQAKAMPRRIRIGA